MQKILGIDWGLKKIGLAIGDDEMKLAVPLSVAKDLAEVLKIAKAEEASLLVIGQPIKMSGDKSNLTSGFQEFVNGLQKAGFEVKLIDERLTTRQAEGLIVENRKASAKQDAVAAMIILQAYFDHV